MFTINIHTNVITILGKIPGSMILAAGAYFGNTLYVFGGVKTMHTTITEKLTESNFYKI